MAEFNLTQLQFVATKSLMQRQMQDMSEATLEAYYRIATEEMLISMKLLIWGRQTDRRVIKWPADWWEALKLRFAPFWFTRRYPVRWNTAIITRHDLYPGLKLQGVKPVPFFEVWEGSDNEDGDE